MGPKQSQSQSRKGPAIPKHADHDYIAARQEKYSTAWHSKDPKAVMEFIEEDGFAYLNRADPNQKITEGHEAHSIFEKTFSHFHDFKIETLSLHGHKNFTTWEWDMSFKRVFNEDGKRLSEEEGKTEHMKGCTLMWWNEKDKIVRQHDYFQFFDA